MERPETRVRTTTFKTKDDEDMSADLNDAQINQILSERQRESSHVQGLTNEEQPSTVSQRKIGSPMLPPEMNTPATLRKER